MNTSFFKEIDKELRNLIFEKKKIDGVRKIWTDELITKYKLIKTKIKILNDVIKYFDPLNEIFVNKHSQSNRKTTTGDKNDR